jgi:hypothetical protein
MNPTGSLDAVEKKIHNSNPHLPSVRTSPTLTELSQLRT